MTESRSGTATMDRRWWSSDRRCRCTAATCLLAMLFGTFLGWATVSAGPVRGDEAPVDRPVIDRSALVADLVAGRRPAELPRTFKTGRHEAGCLQYIEGIPVLQLQGTPEEIGRQRAALEFAHIRGFFGLPEKMLEDSGLPIGWGVATTVGRALWTRAPADYQKELAATLTALDSTDEEADTVIVGNALVEMLQIGGCTSIVIDDEKTTGDGPLFGRNLDLNTDFGVLTKLSLVTIYRPDDKLAFASIGYAGMSGVISGVNEAGLCVATHSVYRSKDKSAPFNPLGTPMYTTFRRVLEECKTVDEAEDLVEDISFTKAGIWMVCDADEAAVFEITTKSFAVRRGDADEAAVACTNHFVTSDLAVHGGDWRWPRLEEMLREERRWNTDRVQWALGEVGHDGTRQAMVFGPSGPTLAVSLGPPPAAKQKLVRLDLKSLLAGKPSDETSTEEASTEATVIPQSDGSF